MQRLTDERKVEIRNFIKDNFSKIGSRKCSLILNISPATVCRYARLMGLKSNSKLKAVYKNNVNLNLFEKISDPNMAYFLGLIFSDGDISHKYVSFTSTLKDWIYYEPIFKQIGKYSICHRNRERNGNKCQPSVNIRFFDVKFSKILGQNGIKDNNFDTILKYIPENLHNYFWRGLFDGDGCAHLKKNNILTLSISSNYDFDWSKFEDFLLKNEINFRLDRIISKFGHKHSLIAFGSRESITKFYSLIYKDYKINKVGLPRKHDKFIIYFQNLLNTAYKNLYTRIYKNKNNLFDIKLKICNFIYKNAASKEEALIIKENYIKQFFQNNNYCSKFIYSEQIKLYTELTQ